MPDLSRRKYIISKTIDNYSELACKQYLKIVALQADNRLVADNRLLAETTRCSNRPLLKVPVVETALCGKYLSLKQRAS